MNTRALIQALPQFRELISRLGLHINISSLINDALTKRKLNEIGMLEQVRRSRSRSRSRSRQALALALARGPCWRAARHPRPAATRVCQARRLHSCNARRAAAAPS
jgi:hypothetical protein